MYYKPIINDVIERYRKLWARELMDKILVKIDILEPNFTVLNAMNKAPNFEEMVNEWEKGFDANKNIKDDNLPVIYGDLGAYITGGFFGAEVIWSKGGAYSKPLIKEMKNYKDFLKFDENNTLYKMQMNYIKYLEDKSKGNFGFTEMPCLIGLNFLDCLRGGEAYTDVYDYPNEVKDIMGFATNFSIQFEKNQRNLIAKYNNGRFHGYQIWAPDETIFVSVDAYGQCGPEIFEKFGRSYIQDYIDEFKYGWLHVHSDAMRLLTNYVTLNNLIAIGLEDWILPPRAIENINTVKEITKDIPLMINIQKDELIEMINEKVLPGNILYWVMGVKSEREANEISEIAHKYKAKYNRKFY